MANNITGNPWYLDTVGVIWHGNVYVKNIIWNKPTAGTALIILDDAGRTILNTVANTNDPMFDFGQFSWVNGFNLATLASGTLSVVIQK
jgi:hypothetical protein